MSATNRKLTRPSRTLAGPRLEREAAACLGSFGATVPIPVERIAEVQGASLSFQAFEGDISGVVLRREGRAVIGVNSAHPRTRQRFTIAHEIGHLRLHRGQPLIVDALVRVNLRAAASVPDTAIEIEANRFAAALLMPAALVRRESQRHIGHGRAVDVDALVDDLARRFAVSPQAMRYRLREVGILTHFETF